MTTPRLASFVEKGARVMLVAQAKPGNRTTALEVLCRCGVRVINNRLGLPGEPENPNRKLHGRSPVMAAGWVETGHLSDGPHGPIALIARQCNSVDPRRVRTRTREKAERSAAATARFTAATDERDADATSPARGTRWSWSSTPAPP